MILSDFLKALGQLGDPRFRRVLFLGLGLTVALLVGFYAVVVWVLQLVTPDTFTIWWIGEVTWIDDILSVASLFLMLGLSVFLMVPVASAFTGFFLEDVAEAVEHLHYPELPDATPAPFSDNLRETFRFMLLLVGANIAAFVLYLMLPFFAPLIFFSLNGFLLGREYFQIAAIRRVGRAGARDLWRRNMPQIWMAGTLMAVPLTVPVLNLLVPILGAATFTHLFHRLKLQASDSSHQNRAR